MPPQRKMLKMPLPAWGALAKKVRIPPRRPKTAHARGFDPPPFFTRTDTGPCRAGRSPPPARVVAARSDSRPPRLILFFSFFSVFFFFLSFSFSLLFCFCSFPFLFLFLLLFCFFFFFPSSFQFFLFFQALLAHVCETHTDVEEEVPRLSTQRCVLHRIMRRTRGNEGRGNAREKRERRPRFSQFREKKTRFPLFLRRDKKQSEFSTDAAAARPIRTSRARWRAQRTCAESRASRRGSICRFC